MNAVLMVVLVLLVGLALVVGGTGLLALVGKLPGNGLLGVRTPETRRSPQAWQLANRAAGPAFLGSGLVLLLGALALGLIGGWVGALVVVVAVLGALALLNAAGLAGSRTAAMWDAGQDDPGQAGCGCGPDGCGDHSHTPSGGDSCSAARVGDSCSSSRVGDSSDPADDCGVSDGCGSCALQGMCESETTAP